MVNRRLVGAEIVERERARGRGGEKKAEEEKASLCVGDCLENPPEKVNSPYSQGCSETESCSVVEGSAISPLPDPCCCYGDRCTSGGVGGASCEVGAVTSIVRQLLPRAKGLEPRREVVTMGKWRRRGRRGEGHEKWLERREVVTMGI